MSSFRPSYVIAAASSAGLWVYQWLGNNNLQNTDFVLGWVLCTLGLVLASYNLRKRLSMLPLISASAWLNAHVVIGFLTLFVFTLHAGLGLPSSAIDLGLWLSFLITLISGIFGIFFSRFYARKVSQFGERLLYDRIPALMHGVAEQARILALQASADEGGEPLGDYFRRKLLGTFSRRGVRWTELFGDSNPVLKHLNELDGLARYLDETNLERQHEIKNLVQQKGALDWQYTTLGWLRNWTWIHVPASVASWFLLVFHILINYAFEMPGG